MNKTYFSYCMNNHPASNYQELKSNLTQFARPIKEAVKEYGEMSIELHLNDIVANETLNSCDDLINHLKELNLLVTSINNFPLIDFHQPIVKEKVYLPNWAHSERLESTKTCAQILANIVLAQPESKSIQVPISTLAGCYQYHDYDSDQMLENFLSMADFLIQLNQDNNIHLTLALEPEPQTTLDTKESIIKFFKKDLKIKAEQTKRNYDQILKVIGLNFDTCHSSVIFEKPKDVVEELLNQNIPIFKFHITSAPKFCSPITKDKIEALKKLNEPKYLHQTYTKIKNKIIAYQDLNLLVDSNIMDVDEIRTHFHTPLYLTDFGPAKTTNNEVEELLQFLKTIPNTYNFVTETYTWPQHLDAIEAENFDIKKGIQDEVSWLMKAWNSA